MGQSDINHTSQDRGNYSSTAGWDEMNRVVSWAIICVGLVVTPIIIYAVYSLLRKDNVAPIYIINLLVSDLIQLCCMILMKIESVQKVGFAISYFGLMVSVCFMVCVALERYLAIVWPLWYRARHTVRMSLVVCAVVWTLALFYLLLLIICMDQYYFFIIIFCVFLLLPFPLFIFFLVGTLKALSASASLSANEKRRIVGLLVLVLLIYTVLFLPGVIYCLIENTRASNLHPVSLIAIKLSPLADSFLYVFLSKGSVHKVLFSLCCCRKDDTSQPSNNMNHIMSSL